MNNKLPFLAAPSLAEILRPLVPSFPQGLAVQTVLASLFSIKKCVCERGMHDILLDSYREQQI